MIAYKLLHVRRDGSIGPLFINRRLRITPGVWMRAECHPTRGFAVRPGWHASPVPSAPHLGTKNRRWYRVELRGVEELLRPACQGGLWLIATYMRVLEPVTAPSQNTKNTPTPHPTTK